MNEEEKTGKAVAQLLNQSLHDITPGELYQLQAARRAALENYQPAEDIFAQRISLACQPCGKTGSGNQFFAFTSRTSLLAAKLQT